MRIMSMVREKMHQRKALVQERKMAYDDEYKKQLHTQTLAIAKKQAQANAKRDAGNVGKSLATRLAENLKTKSNKPVGNTLFTQKESSNPFTSLSTDNPFYSKKK